MVDSDIAPDPSPAPVTGIVETGMALSSVVIVVVAAFVLVIVSRKKKIITK